MSPVVKGIIVAKKDVSPDRSVGLDVRIAHELIEQARRSGVSLVGEGGLLAGITKTAANSS